MQTFHLKVIENQLTRIRVEGEESPSERSLILHEPHCPIDGCSCDSETASVYNMSTVDGMFGALANMTELDALVKS